MMRKYYVIIFFVTLSLGNVIAQEKSIIPPSPISSEFAKYITQEVSLYNGIPEISIPLYSIQLKGLTIPINLSYHASGIKFRQASGIVGVGWVLNPGYRISRTVNGYADELQPMPSDILSTLEELESDGNLQRDKYLARFVPGCDYGNESFIDGEYDNFVFSTPNASGEFIITNRNNNTVTTTEESNLLVDYKVPGLEGIKGFQITDEIGNKYGFGEYNQQNQDNTESTSAYYGSTINTAWGLSEIITPIGDEVKFKYIKGSNEGSPIDHIKSFFISEADFNECNYTTSSENYGGAPGYYTFYNSEIITPSEKIIFTYNNTNSTYSKRIENIKIFTSAGILIKAIRFFYSQNYYHTFLDNVKIYDSNDNVVEVYSFDYISKNTTSNYTMDHFGYYLETGYQNLYYHQEFLDDPIWNRDEGSCSLKQWGRTVGDFMVGLTVSREPTNYSTDVFSLKKITYPTGGYTEYEYESAKYGDVGSDGGTYRYAGIRIKTIKSSDLRTAESLVKSYSYGNNDKENGIGISEVWVGPELFVNEKIYHNYTERVHQRLITYSTTMQGDIGSVLGQSGLVKYPCVTEYYSSSNPSANGKTEYYFNVGDLFEARPLSRKNNAPNENYHQYPLYIYNYRPWNKPQLVRKKYYSLNDGKYIPLQEEVFEYEQNSISFAGLKVEQSVSGKQGPLTIYDYLNTLPEINSYFNYGEYTIEIGENLLKRKFEYNYLNGKTFSTEYNYEYSNHLLSKETVKRSTGDVLINYTTYPLDYPSGSLFIDDMKGSHILSYPIEKVNCLEKGADKLILSGTINTFKPGGKGLLDSELSIENSEPISISNFKFSNLTKGIFPSFGNTSIFFPDNSYTKRITYDNYDAHGNVLQMHKESNVNVSYIWGYNGVYPVIKGDNVDQNTLESAVNNSLPSGYSSLELLLTNIGDMTQPEQQTLWKNFCDRLIIQSTLKNTVLSIYTYKPLIGITSQTEQNGKSIYYKYDSYGRLKSIIDHNHNILKEFDYHYRNN